MQLCANDHFLDGCDRNLCDILTQHGFNSQPRIVVKTALDNNLNGFLSTDCVEICIAFLSVRDYFHNCFAKDDLIDAKIIDEVMPLHFHKIRKIAKQNGVCNTLIMMSQLETVHSASSEYILMFVAVGKYYGQDRFFNVLRSVGVVPQRQDYIFSEVLNMMAEYWNMTRSRCLLGGIYCRCFVAHPSLMEAQNVLEQSNVNEAIDEIEVLMGLQFPEVIPVLQKRALVSDEAASKKRKF